MLTINEYSAVANEAIRGIRYPGGDLNGLYEPIAYALDAGGKRLRPVLCLMACDAFCDEAKRSLNQALGLEMFHNFTLLHDDVMDNSDLRRGRETVHKRWDENAAILSGDTMLTLATQLVADTSAELLPEVLKTFNDMAIKVYEGQQLDMDFESREDVTVSEYLRMVSFKTGALLGASAKIGALVGGASADDADRMYEFGNSVGIAFQVEDDYLDVYGDEKTFGKPIGGDIRNRKKTFLLLSGLAGDSSTASELNRAFATEDPELRVSRVTDAYTRLGIKDICLAESRNWTSKALEALEATELSDEAKASLRALAEKLIGRSI